MQYNDQTRRYFLSLLTVAGTGALAGCTGDDDDDTTLEPVEDEDDEDDEVEDDEVEDDEVEDDEVEDEDDEDDEVEDEDDEDDEVEDEDDEDDELRQMDLSWGDTVEHPDGFHITPAEPEIVESYEVEDFTGETEVIEPEREQFVFIEITVENVIDSTITTPNALDFEVIVDNQQFERRSVVDRREDDERYPSLEDLASGSVASGVLSYDTPTGDPELFYNGVTEDFETVEAIWS